MAHRVPMRWSLSSAIKHSAYEGVTLFLKSGGKRLQQTDLHFDLQCRSSGKMLSIVWPLLTSNRHRIATSQ